MSPSSSLPLPTLANSPASARHKRAVLWTCAAFAAVTLAALPWAASPWPNLPAFVPVYGAITATCYLLSAYILLAEARVSGSRSLLVLACGTIFTAGTLLLQLASVPGLFGPARLIGGAQTTIWLWTAWHLGPPAYGLLYAAIEERDRDGALPEPARRRARWIGLAATAAALAVVGAAVTWLHDWLPIQNEGPDYSLITRTGAAPAVTALSAVAAMAVWMRTRGRTVVDQWLVASLFMLVCDNAVTMVGGMRDSVGWYVGRLEALGSASVLLIVYLREIGAVVRRLAAGAAALLDAHRKLAVEAEHRRQAEEKLRQAQKLEAIGQLTGGVAHDFNNLLTVVIGHVERAQSAHDEFSRRHHLTGALRAAERGARLTSDLLAFGRRQHLVPQTVDVNDLLRSFAELLERSVGPLVKVELRLDPAAWPASVDPNALEMAVLNLAINARDAMANGGTLLIETGNLDARSASPAPDLSQGDHVVIVVSDTGIGMSEEVRERAFEPFFTTKEVGKGSGLGLSQVYGFVKQSGGSATINSAAGLGTKICLFVPRAAEAGEVEAPELRRSPANVDAPQRRSVSGG